MISLEPITRDNLRAVTALVPREDQRNFVATNAFSIAQVYVEPDWMPLALYADGVPVGFALLGRETDKGLDWIIRFMIDQHQQGKGYGRAAMEAVIAHMRAFDDPGVIHLSFVQGNAIAEALYRSVGFEPTGEIDDGEIVMRLTTPQDR